MSTHLMPREAAVERPAEAEGSRLLSAYADLAKARLSMLVVTTTAVGYAVTVTGPFDVLRFVFTLIGTALAAGGANGLNQYIERDLDRRMERTRTRPIPSGLLSPRHAALASASWAIAGPALLAWRVNALAGALALITIVVYLAVYTPLKRRTPLCTLVGGVSGAIPPMIGCAAATGTLGFPAWLLFTLLFVWQIPHFLSLAWLYRHDYAAGGFKMLPVVDPTGARTCRVALTYAVMLLPAGLVFTITGLAGWWAGLASLLFGGAFVVQAIRLHRRRSADYARKLFHGSLLYLTAMMIVLVIDRGPALKTPWPENGFRVVGVESTPPDDR